MIASYEVKTKVQSSYIDNSILEEIKEFMGDEGESTITELIGIYLDKTPQAIVKIAEDLKSGNIESLKAHVHGLKGSSAGVGAVGISSTCKRIEDVLNVGNLDDVYALFERMIDIYKHVEIEFRERL